MSSVLPPYPDKIPPGSKAVVVVDCTADYEPRGGDELVLKKGEAVMIIGLADDFCTCCMMTMV